MARLLAPLALLLSIPLLAAPPAAWPAAPEWPAGRAPADLTGRLALENGFEAFVVPRPGAPLVALLVAVEAGSRHETPATRGAAHLLEHLVFEGTASRSRDGIFRWVYGAGGYLNGFTRDDFTGYVLMGPPDELEAMARLLADLLSGARLSAEAIERVRSIVLEELRQAEADPAYRDDVAFRAALLHGTAYAEPVLGTEATIRAIALDDVTRFYRERYTPGNMVALALGGAGAEAMASALRAAFGPLPAGPRGAASTARDRPAARAPLSLPPAGAVVRLGRQRALRLGLVGPPPSDPAFADFLALGDLLAGPATPLAAALAAAGAPEGLEPSVEAGVGGRFATLEVRAALPPGADADGALAALLTALSSLAGRDAPDEAQGAITAGALGRSTRHARLEAARLAERLHYFAMARMPLLVAGRADLALGEPAAAEPAAVRAALARALAGGFVALLPAGTGVDARDAAGPRGAPRREARLANGIAVVAETRAGSPLVAAHLLARGRLLAEPPGQAGAAEVLHRLLLKGPPVGATGPLEARLAALGATVSVADDPREPFGDFYLARDFSGIRLEALAEHAEAALGLLARAVAAPPLDPASVAAARDETAALAAWRAGDARALAEDRLFGRLFEGALGSPPAGAAESLARLTPEALAAFHRRYFATENLVLTVVGGEPPERLVALAEATFGRLEPGPGGDPAPATPAGAAAGEAPLRLPAEGPQAQVRIGLVVPAGDARERAALSIAVGLLGASLFRTLREEQGLAYAVGAEASLVGPWAAVTAGLGTGPEEADRALVELRRLVAARAAAPVRPEEVALRAKAIAGRLASRQLSSATRAYYLGVAVHQGAPHRFGDDYAALLASITPDEVEAAQRRAFSRPLAAVIVR